LYTAHEKHCHSALQAAAVNIIIRKKKKKNATYIQHWLDILSVFKNTRSD